MGGHKQKKKTNFNWAKQEPYVLSNRSAPARNMRKTDIGSVIFGCTNSTINECLSKQLFGLPEGHFAYIKNISKGLALFLFNYSDRKLHGIFEAAGPGQMNIDKYAWVADGDDSGYTYYPAQVRICFRQECRPLSEQQFGPIIANNYYETKHFYFELDHHQTNQLISLFEVNPVNEVKYPQIPRPKRSFEVVPKNLNQTSTLSYASVLGDCSSSATATSSSHPTRQWSSLFKTESTIDEQSNGIQDSNSSFSASDAHEEKAEIPRAHTWDEEARIWNGQADSWDVQADTCDGEVDTWNGQSDTLGKQQANTWEQKPIVTADDGEVDTWNGQSDTLGELQTNTWGEQRANTWEEQQPIVTADEVTGFHTWEQPKTCEDRPSSESDETEEGDTEETENHENENSTEPDTVKEQEASNDLQSLVVKLMQEVKELKGSQTKQIVKVNVLQQELVQSKQEIDQLRTSLSNLVSRSGSIVDPADVDTQLLSKSQSNLVESVYIVGGFDGSSWMSTIESYFPYHDHKCSLSPMKFVKTYASAATFNAEIFHFGGGGYHTVESFNPTTNQWNSRPPLHWKNIYAAGASINDRLFVVGGANGSGGPSEVEYLDLIIGKWLPTRAMQSKRLGPAVAELNNALYVTGGYDGASYLSSVERFDPREEAWYNLPSMNTRKGCHSLVVLHQKL
uniref:uncharacterized protein LOC122604934 n=1 Tax=Erigeron canadensis TaxID=72917 RepID=UPI001CB99C3C|nr:uncharacterized protein LOC122604934 [Erigeron canadensis]